MGVLRHLTPGSLRRRYLDIMQRLGRLENSVWNLDMVVDALILNPTYTPGDHAGLNGQLFRKRIFTEIASIGLDAIVETGTFMGDTAGYMAETVSQPVYSCEVNPRFHAIATMRLAGKGIVNLRLSDSQDFLRDLTDELVDRCVFFYLDSHWDGSLPLKHEVEWIAAHWDRYVIMIDDFKVPDDSGYGYDHYGQDILELELLRGTIAQHDLVAYFPAARSDEETGAKRGCIVLTPRGDLSDRLSRLESLREFSGRSGPR